MDFDEGRHNETIDIQYSDPGGTKFSFVTRMSVPIPKTFEDRRDPQVAFSADGSKFAIYMAHDGISVWDIRNKVPLKTFMEVLDYSRPVEYLQFSSGKLGKEVLVFVEVRLMSRF